MRIDDELSPGHVIDGRYRVERVLHRGTKAMVYAVTHQVTKVRLAMKVLASALTTDPEAIARFRQEARIASSIGDPHVLAPVDFGVLPDHTPYLLSELVDGETIAERLTGGAPFTPLAAIQIGIQLCEGLSAIHARGVAHRNIEPTNVMIAGTEPRVVIVDFFFARTIGSPSFAATGRTMIGRPPFAAPEQLRDPASADQRSDVWSVGVVLATMLAGEPPFAAPSFAELVAALIDGASPRLAPSIPAPLAAVISRCLGDPATRYPSAAELAAALRSCRGN